MINPSNKSDIVKFLKPLQDELEKILMDTHYPAVAEFWQSYDRAMLELREIAPVLELMRQHDETWHDLDEMRWLAGLVEEVGELASSMMHRHDDPIAWEMMQIATISLNYLRLYSTPRVMQNILQRKQEA